MADEDKSILPRPAEPAITWQKKTLTAKRLVEVWDTASDAMRAFHEEVRRARSFRRGTLVRTMAESWAKKHPEAAEAAKSRLHQRRTLEQDLKARMGAVEPVYVRNAIGDLESDLTAAEQCEDYLNEWATSEYGVPYSTFLTKGVEDGGYLRVRLPAAADMEGRPDFFERLSERAHAKLSDDEKGQYERDDKHPRRPYVKLGEDGKPQPKPRYARIMAESDEDKKLSGIKRADRAKARTEKASAAHNEAVQRYLLQRAASTAQVYGGLDVAPIFKRGSGREQATLAAAVTRQLVSVEEALEQGYGWKGMNGRLLAPRGASETNKVGRDGQYYLYTMYLTSTDDDGIEHPLIVYTLGGYGTTYQAGGVEPDSKDAVGFIDLYDEYGIEGPLWSWHWGLMTGDDEPAYRGRPYLSDLIDLMLAIEGEEMAIRGTTQVSSFTGHVEKLGNALSGRNSEAVLEAVIEKGPGDTRALRKGKIPAPGEIVTTIGDVEPFQQSQIGRDAWQILASDRQSLTEATAVDQAGSAPGASGHAIVVGETLAKTAKRDIRQQALEAFRQDGEDHMKILAAYAKLHGINWPIQKVEEPPSDSEDAPRFSVAEFDLEWIGDGQFLRLAAEFPDEENLAAVDLEAALADRGYSHFEAVMKKRGIMDPEREWKKVLKWKMRNHPLYIESVMSKFATKRGDKTMADIIKQLQEQQKMTQAGAGAAAPNGVPTAALRRMGEAGPQQTGQGGPTAASSARGGIKAGEMQTAAMQNDAMAQMAVA